MEVVFLFVLVLSRMSNLAVVFLAGDGLFLQTSVLPIFYKKTRLRQEDGF